MLKVVGDEVKKSERERHRLDVDWILATGNASGDDSYI